MRTLVKNRQKFWWAAYIGTEDIIDADGNYTGQRVPKYGEPHEAYGNISGSTNTVNSYYKDNVNVWPFGIADMLEKVIVMADPDEPIKADSILWVGKDPMVEDGKATAPYNYVVKNITRSLNNLTIAIHEVKTSGSFEG